MNTVIRPDHQTPWREREFLSHLKKGELALPPLRLRVVEAEAKAKEAFCPDGILEVQWQQRADRFVIEYKSLSTPKTLEDAMAQAERISRNAGLPPLVIMPYLSETSLQTLEKAKISGLDLCGNAILLTPEFYFWRSGQPNRFRSSQPIRNVFRGNSSILARCFLLRSEFPTLVDLRRFALERLQTGEGVESEMMLTKGTVSKVVQALVEEKILVRGKEKVRLASPERLLEQLRANYPRQTGPRLEGQMACTATEAWAKIAVTGLRAITTGDGAAGKYGLLSGAAKLALYVEDLGAMRDLLEITPTPVFPNIELIESRSDFVYFDARCEGSVRWASPIQTWLELSLAGPREQEAARTLEAALLRGEEPAWI